MNDLISVIIPTYNREHIILDAIKSVENQGHSNYEIIVVDDCSTDQTRELLQDLDTIKYLRLNNNKGNAGARNAGVKLAQGKYIVFLDSDDQMEKHCLKSFSELIERKPKTMFAFGGYYILNTETGDKIKKMWKPDPSKSFLKDLKIGTGCGLMVKKECFDNIGYFDERLRVAVDTDWLIRLEKRYTYEVIDDYLVTVFKHPGKRVRNNKKELLRSYELLLEKNSEEIYADPAILFKFLYKLQWLNYQANNLKIGNRLFFKQIKQGVFRIKALISFVLYNCFPLEAAKNIHNKISGSSI